MNVKDIREKYKKAYQRNGDKKTTEEQFYVYPNFRFKPKLELERLYDSNEIPYERKTYKMMPLKLETEEDNKVEYKPEDFQHDDLIANHMNKIMYLTEKDVKRKEEEDLKKEVLD